MRLRNKSLITFSIWLLVFHFNYASDKRNIAVLDFENLGVSESEAKVLTNRLRTILISYPQYQLVERGKMEQILNEQQFQLSGCTSDECVVEVGQLLGVELMLTGSFGLVGSTYTIDIRIIDVGTSKVITTAQHNLKGQIDDVLEYGLQDVLDKLLKTKQTLATLKIITTPSQAEIELNGVKKGLSPLTIKNLRANTKMALTVSKDGFIPQQQSLNLKPGEENTISMTLEKLKGEISVTGHPAKASIRFNNQRAGTSPLSNYQLTIGEYDLTVTKPEYAKSVQKIVIDAKTPAEINFALKPLSKKRALAYSLVLPGTGQMYQKYPLKGLSFLVSGLALSYLSWDSHTAYLDARNTWNLKRDIYNHNLTRPDLWEQQLSELNTAYNNLKDTEKQRNLFIGGLGAVWTINLIEIAF